MESLIIIIFFRIPPVLLKWKEVFRLLGPVYRQPADCREIRQIVVTNTDRAFML
jgi:hypothetical protein